MRVCEFYMRFKPLSWRQSGHPVMSDFLRFADDGIRSCYDRPRTPSLSGESEQSQCADRDYTYPGMGPGGMLTYNNIGQGHDGSSHVGLRCVRKNFGLVDRFKLEVSSSSPGRDLRSHGSSIPHLTFTQQDSQAPSPVLSHLAFKRFRVPLATPHPECPNSPPAFPALLHAKSKAM
jgi:hypothetical protein